MKKILVVLLVIVSIVSLLSAQRIRGSETLNRSYGMMQKPNHYDNNVKGRGLTGQRFDRFDMMHVRTMNQNMGSLQIKDTFILLAAEKYAPELVNDFLDLYKQKEQTKGTHMKDIENMTLGEIRSFRETHFELRDLSRELFIQLNTAIQYESESKAKEILIKILNVEKDIINLLK